MKKISFSKREKRLFGIVIATFLAFYIFLALHVVLYTFPQQATNQDAAIVLGAKSYRGDTYNPCLVSRVETAIALYTNKKVTKIILSGGTDREDNVNEAETMKKIAIDNNIPEHVLLLENKATSTYENLQFSKHIMDSHNISSVIIVTEPFHVARARLIARSLGIDAQYVAAEDSPCWTRWKYLSRYFLKEPLAIVYYIFTGKISLFAF